MWPSLPATAVGNFYPYFNQKPSVRQEKHKIKPLLAKDSQ